MIGKNLQGRIVVFKDKSILPSRQARKNDTSSGTTSGSQESETSPASEEEIELRHKAAVMRAREDSNAAAGTEMAQLAARVAELDAGAKRAREAARQKLKSVQTQAEQLRRLMMEQAEADYDAVLDCIRADFHAAVAPINAEAAEMLARQTKSLDETLSSLRELRAKQLAALAEPRNSATPEVTTENMAPMELLESHDSVDIAMLAEKTEEQATEDPRSDSQLPRG